MPLRPDPLPKNAAQLTRIILSLNEENADLKARVAFLERQLFGTKSEKMTTIDPTQAILDLGDLSDIPVAANDDVAPVGEGKTQARRSPARNIGHLPKHLARYDEVIEPEDKTCPCCSFDLHCIGTDVSEALDIVPAIVRVKRTIRPRYACRACEGVVVQAPAPARVMDGGMGTTAFAAHVAVSKFAWHLPLHRQAQMLATCGVTIDRGTLGAWVTRAAWWLELLYDALTVFIRSQPRVFCDETPLPQLDPGRKRTKVCQLWAQAVDDRPWNGPAPPAVAYTFAESRSAREVEGQLSSFAGVLQVDGYQAYKTMVKRRGKSNVAPMRLAFCLAHARRKFVDVVKLTGSSEALSVLARIAEIYRIEADLRGKSADTRLVVRRSSAAPIIRELKAKLTELRDEVSSKSALGKAVAYTLNHWSGLVAFLEDGRIEVDTNIVERSMKSVALTRKNALFVGNERGGKTFAVLASLVNTAKLNSVNPQTWLTDVLERIISGKVKANEMESLLPWAWKAEREAIDDQERRAA
ncbi:IS66 family transposase [Agrobacterium rhizogenes]|uniref:IS66 family transposase n=1 Tax=Rhizobium rhizogenes TaxID=359 RepID=UPI0015744D47|nr:IS66 family transposase [Rhizobium rhizogenes]NTH14220.1 IS66 family transposase [Rhizobium rhizogenes]